MTDQPSPFTVACERLAKVTYAAEEQRIAEVEEQLRSGEVRHA